MLKYLRYLFIALVALVLLSLALSNRQSVPVRLFPEDMANFIGFGHGVQLPLFLVILVAMAAGVLIGFVWEWFREMRIRGQARTQTKAVARLERELAVLKDSNSVPPKDEVLAILEESARK